MSTFILIFCVLLFLLFIIPFLFYRKPVFSDSIQQSVTLIVPFRNESERIGLLLYSLLNLKPNYCRILFVDDHSEDNTASVIQDFKSNHGLDFIEILTLPEDLSGKKNAQIFAAQNADSDWLYFLDADTEISAQMIDFLQQLDPNSPIRFVQGFPLFYQTKPNFLSHFLYIEFLTLVGFGFLSRFYGIPLLANAAVMALKKSDFLQADLKSYLISGDDVFTMQSIRKVYGLQALYFAPFFVKTLSPGSISESLHQKKRWVSKWGSAEYLAYVFLSAWVLIPTVASFVFPTYAQSLILLFPILPLLCISVLFVYSARFNSLPYLLPCMLLLPLYLVVMPLILYRFPARWKNRKV